MAGAGKRSGTFPDTVCLFKVPFEEEGGVSPLTRLHDTRYVTQN
jgi:hypothetical protein